MPSLADIIGLTDAPSFLSAVVDQDYWRTIADRMNAAGRRSLSDRGSPIHGLLSVMPSVQRSAFDEMQSDPYTSFGAGLLGSIKSNRIAADLAMFRKYAERAGLAVFDDGGSTQSASKYLSILNPADKDEYLKVRFSDHDLPSHYERPAVDVRPGSWGVQLKGLLDSVGVPTPHELNRAIANGYRKELRQDLSMEVLRQSEKTQQSIDKASRGAFHYGGVNGSNTNYRMTNAAGEWVNIRKKDVPTELKGSDDILIPYLRGLLGG